MHDSLRPHGVGYLYPVFATPSAALLEEPPSAELALFEQELALEDPVELLPSDLDGLCRLVPLADEPPPPPAAAPEEAGPARGPADQSTLGQILRWMGQVPLLTLEEEVDYARRVAAGKEAAGLLASGLGLRAEDLRLWARLRQQGRALPGGLEAVAQAMAALPRDLRRARLVLLDGEHAYTRLVEANLRLVVYVAKRFHRRVEHLRMEDLVQEGALGLMHAADRFDWTRRIKFSTYAHWWIRQAVLRAIATRESAIRLPVEKSAALGRGAKARAGADAEELEALARLTQPLSLDQPVDADSDGRVGDVIPSGDDPAAAALQRVFAQQVRACLRRMHPELAVILGLWTGVFGGGPFTAPQIAQFLGRSPDTVSEKLRDARAAFLQLAQQKNLQAFVE